MLLVKVGNHPPERNGPAPHPGVGFQASRGFDSGGFKTAPDLRRFLSSMSKACVAYRIGKCGDGAVSAMKNRTIVWTRVNNSERVMARTLISYAVFDFADAVLRIVAGWTAFLRPGR
jgi:hypothetical protein